MIPDADVDMSKMRELFEDIDTDKNGHISFEEFVRGMRKLGMAPHKMPLP